MSVTQSYRPSRVLVFFLVLVAVATFGTILLSVRGPSAPPVEVADEAKQQRDQWKQQLVALQQEVKGLQTSQQKLAGEMDDVRRQISREAGERKLLSDQVGSLSARVNGLSAKDVNAIETLTPQKKRR
jgi:septal ring factor EnvC (AmiA/AmiB activator)